MGNIKTTFVKRIGRKLFENNRKKFTEDYSKNKELIKELIDIKSKKMRNIIAGYVTNLKRQEGG
jgi:small subunit ribosomal protein S17e